MHSRFHRPARRIGVVAALVLGAGLLRAATPAPEHAAAVFDPVTHERLGELTYGMTPGRYLDTRPGAPTVDGRFAGNGPLTPGSPLVVSLRGRPAIPDAATGVMLNVTVTGAAGDGYLTVWPEGSAPVTSTLNFTRGQTVANFAFSALGSDGAIRISVTGGAAHVLVDVIAFTSDLPSL